MTEDGPKVFLDSPFLLEGTIKLPPVYLTLPFGWSRSRTIQYLRDLQFKVSSIVSHEPIFNKVLEKAIASERMSLEELELRQRITDGEDWYKDEFGLPVFGYSFLSETPTFTDKRYES